jgi:hypothetical protein
MSMEQHLIYLNSDKTTIGTSFDFFTFLQNPLALNGSWEASLISLSHSGVKSTLKTPSYLCCDLVETSYVSGVGQLPVLDIIDYNKEACVQRGNGLVKLNIVRNSIDIIRIYTHNGTVISECCEGPIQVVLLLNKKRC